MSNKTAKEEVLERARRAFGFVPNLIAGMADRNPAVADAYLAATAALEGGSLSTKEQQVVMLAVSAYNDCHYCSAAHRTVAKGLGVSQSDLEAIDARNRPSDERLRRLVQATWTVLSERGWLAPEELEKLEISQEELYEVIALIGLKTMTNYINHIQATEIDAPFKQQAKRATPRLQAV